MPRTKVKCGHKSFWWINFKNLGISMSVLSAATGIDPERLEHFLTGQSMPPRNIAITLCNQFEIPQSTGFKEFRKAHKAWKISHIDKPVATKEDITATYIFELPKLLDGRAHNPGRPKKQPASSILVLPSSIAAQAAAPIVFDDDLELIYGKVSYITYMKFRKGEVTLKDILSELYGKIDLDTYLKIYKS